MSGLLIIARREFLAFFYAPIAYVLGASFLALNGFSFWALMRVLSDPLQPAESGAVLREFFGGTLLHWLVVFALAAVLSMRSVAEDRRTGIWEAMLTTRVEASTVLIGKWLALVLFYILLWLPTLLLLMVFARYLPAQQSMDLGPIAAAYLGVVAIGAALLALGVAVSTTTQSQVVAAIASFTVFVAWLMLGELDELGVGFASGAHWFLLIDLRESLARLARGELWPVVFVQLFSVMLVGLSMAVALTARDRMARRRQWLVVALLLIAGGSLGQLTGRHLGASDWTAARINSLEASTEALLAELTEPVDVILLRPQEQVFDPVHREVERLLERMQAAQPLLVRRDLDPLGEPQSVRQWAFELAIRPEDLASGGAVIFQQGTRRRTVDLLAMAGFAADDLGVGALSEFRAESAFRQGIAEVIDRQREVLCSSTGHGELRDRENSGDASEMHWGGTAQRLRADGVDVLSVRALSAETLRPCSALAILGPQGSLGPAELVAVDEYLEAGGNVLIALRSRPDAGELRRTPAGLELLLDARGMQVREAVVVDPEAGIELPPAWMTYEGYGDHPIVHDFFQRRATVWDAPLALEAHSEEVVELVRASPGAWGERSLVPFFREGRYSRDAEDLPARSVALAREDDSGSRLVVFGSVESLSSIWSERGIGGNQRLLVSAALWVLDRQLQLATENKRPEHLRLVMTSAQLRGAFVWCVVAGPLVFSLLGGLLWWWRRRDV